MLLSRMSRIHSPFTGHLHVPNFLSIYRSFSLSARFPFSRLYPDPQANVWNPQPANYWRSFSCRRRLPFYSLSTASNLTCTLQPLVLSTGVGCYVGVVFFSRLMVICFLKPGLLDFAKMELFPRHISHFSASSTASSSKVDFSKFKASLKHQSKRR